MNIRKATLHDLEIISEVESICFPPSEAASKEAFNNRLQYYPNHFYLLFIDNKLISFVNGMCTDHKNLEDIMYKDASMHKEEGKWQMIFGVNTLPQYRRNGYAAILLNKMIDDAKKEGRAGLVLTCKEHMLSYYGKFGFKNEGVSHSSHGNVLWYQMRLSF